jgi:sulfite oxidase
MNGQPLPPCYGFPVRVTVPGVAGARWVKWLDSITVQRQESPNFYQQHDYKILPPEAATWEIAEQYWDKVPAIQCTPVNSVVAVPDDNETIQLSSEGLVEVKGYAVPRGDQGPVTCVEVSGDDGKTWVFAELEAAEPQSKWCWTLWKAFIKMETGTNRAIFSRATDAGGNVQGKFSEWNIRGVCYCGYGASWNLTVT